MISKDKIASICYIILLKLQIVMCANNIEYKITYKNKCLESSSLLRYFWKVSIPQCVRECANRPTCLSINYRKQQLLCELYAADDGNFHLNDATSGPCVFIRKSSFGQVETLPVEPSVCGIGSCTNTDHGLTISECPTLTFDNGVILGNMRDVGSVAKIVCNTGYIEIENIRQTTCQDPGEWSYIPQCIPIITSCSSTTVYDFSHIYHNVALGKTVTLTDTWPDWPGYQMVDGDNSRCAHTRTVDGYAVIDLEQSYTVYAMYLVNRVDCCPDRLRNVSITIGESLDSLQLYIYHEPVMGMYCTFVLPRPVRARYLKIENIKTEYLTICELEVYGH